MKTRRTALLLLAGLSATVIALAGCSSVSQGELGTTTAKGTIVVPVSEGTGSKTVGTYTIHGDVYISATCVGTGTASITLYPDGGGTAPACTNGKNSTSIVSSSTFIVPSAAKFTVKVKADEGTKWRFEVSTSPDATAAP